MNEKEYNIGDLVEYKQKIYLVTSREYEPYDDADGNRLYTYLYGLHGIDRKIMDMFLEKVQ